jgi:hypothetical protein
MQGVFGPTGTDIVPDSGTQPQPQPQAQLQAERDQVRIEVETKARQTGCRGNILFHYTDSEAAQLIYDSQILFVTRKWGRAPRGAYATDIPPWAPTATKPELAKLFYFAKSRQESAVAEGGLDAFVALCNDTVPPFVPTELPGQWVMEQPRGVTRVQVHAIGYGRNPMP